jgi:hypothetical protein
MWEMGVYYFVVDAGGNLPLGCAWLFYVVSGMRRTK